MTSDIFSATDIANFLACQHLTALDRAEAIGQLKRPYFPDPGLELLRQPGQLHERKYLATFCTSGISIIVEIPVTISATEAAAKTIEAIRNGAHIIYQPVFL